MGAETFITAKSAGKRSDKRARVLLSARLETKAGPISARLRDISSRGALVECAGVPPIDSEVVFVRGKTSVPARVAWTGTGRAGLEFAHEIDEQEVLVDLGKGAKREDDPYRMLPTGARLAGAELRLARAWGVTVGLSVTNGTPPPRRGRK